MLLNHRHACILHSHEHPDQRVGAITAASRQHLCVRLCDIAAEETIVPLDIQVIYKAQRLGEDNERAQVRVSHPAHLKFGSTRVRGSGEGRGLADECVSPPA